MISFLFSFFIVAFGQAAWIPGLGVLAASCGYALFWSSLFSLSTKERVLRSFVWFFCVQLVQVSWMTSIDYMGPWIVLIYFLVSFLLASQFALLSSVVDVRFRFSDCFLMAGVWVILEWSRRFFWFMWNPVALSLVDSGSAIQFASLFGVYGLSFWVIFVNAIGVYLLLNKANLTYLRGACWGVLALLPYLFGFLQEAWVVQKIPIERMYTASLVQTGILPEQKDLFPDRKEAFISPLVQWERILEPLAGKSSSDLIVLPEACVCLGAYRAVYPLEAVKACFGRIFGMDSLSQFPSLEAPFAKEEIRNGKVLWRVSNAFIAQALANHLKADVIAGLDDEENFKKYNAVFHFKAGGSPERYEKRVLVPIGEYIPLEEIQWFSRFLAKEFGIGGSFQVGKDPKLFISKLPIGVSVCVEEVYSHLIYDLRSLGARLFVNVTNDVWFPRSRLPIQHFQHSRIRSAENGVYSLRSCNTGVTAVINCFGKAEAMAPLSEKEVHVLTSSFGVRSFRTLYSLWGDSFILICSCICVGWGVFRRFRCT